MWDKFVELYKESAIIQGLLALTVTVTVCYLYITNNQVPDSLLAILFSVLGFYFGHKNKVMGV